MKKMIDGAADKAVDHVEGEQLLDKRSMRQCGGRCDPEPSISIPEDRLVCENCAKTHAPELVKIREAALSYAERESEAAVESLIDRIKQTISEPLESRIMRAIAEWKGEDVPF